MHKRNAGTVRQNVTLFYMDRSLKYRGEMLNDLYDGWGILHCKSRRRRYKGYWSGGLKNGYGEETRVMKVSTGTAELDSPLNLDLSDSCILIEKYYGQWMEGSKFGFGVLEAKKYRPISIDTNPPTDLCLLMDFDWQQPLTDIHVLEGCWRNNRLNGWGREQKADGHWYEGDWVDGARCGIGLARYPNGDRFEGHWLDGLRCGAGKYWFAKNGSLIEGHWDKDSLTSGTMRLLGKGCT